MVFLVRLQTQYRGGCSQRFNLFVPAYFLVDFLTNSFELDDVDQSVTLSGLLWKYAQDGEPANRAKLMKSHFEHHDEKEPSKLATMSPTETVDKLAKGSGDVRVLYVVVDLETIEPRGPIEPRG